jgi:hypothetical protein
MAPGRLAKAARGELAVPLPAGYARRASGEAALDPDEQVQAVVRLVFRLFDELGTVHGVLRFLVGHQVQIGMRERSGPGKGEVAWRAPHQQGLINMLRNPAYAGIYAYGRSRTDRSPLPHDPIQMDGGTTFHFVTEGPRASPECPQPPGTRTKDL